MGPFISLGKTAGEIMKSITINSKDFLYIVLTKRRLTSIPPDG